MNSRIHEAENRTSLPKFIGADGKDVPYSDHNAKQIFLYNPQPPYDQDWNGWGPRLSVDYAVTGHTTLHAGGAITTIVPNLWQDNFVTGGIPLATSLFRQRVAQCPVALPEQVRADKSPASLYHGGQASVPEWRRQSRGAEHASGSATLSGRSKRADSGEPGPVAHYDWLRQEFPQRLHRELHRGHRPRFQRREVQRRLRGHRRRSSGQRLFAEQLRRRRSRHSRPSLSSIRRAKPSEVSGRSW